MPWFGLCMIMLHVLQVFEDTSGSKESRVLNMARLYIQKLIKEYEYEEKNMPENT